jgi:hypothetical protein
LTGLSAAQSRDLDVSDFSFIFSLTTVTQTT